MSFIPINLDNLTPEEALEYNKVFTLLAEYCENKHRAAVMRRSGYTKEACSSLVYCEEAYQQLPEWARW